MVYGNKLNIKYKDYPKMNVSLKYSQIIGEDTGQKNTTLIKTFNVLSCICRTIIIYETYKELWICASTALKSPNCTLDMHQKRPKEGDERSPFRFIYRGKYVVG